MFYRIVSIQKHAAACEILLADTGTLDDILKDINEPLLAWYGSRGNLPWRTDLSDDQLQALPAEEKAQRAYQVCIR